MFGSTLVRKHSLAGAVAAARVDGARMTQAFRYVILPMTRPIAATIVVLTLWY
jgi:ABC-type glycerol-3-phosphate transport system permease component